MNKPHEWAGRMFTQFIETVDDGSQDSRYSIILTKAGDVFYVQHDENGMYVHSPNGELAVSKLAGNFVQLTVKRK